MKLLNSRFSKLLFTLAAVVLAATQLTTAQMMRPANVQSANGMTAKPDAQMQQVLDNLAALKPIPIETLTPGEARYQPAFPDALKQTIQKKTRSYPMPEPVAKVEDITIPVTAGQIAGRIYTPSGKGPFPVVVYYHGGGFVIASINAYDSSARSLTNGAGAIVVAVEYRKAPEAKFPAAHNDSIDAYQWVLANAASFGGDAKRVAVLGESAGGNLAANVAIAARDRSLQMPLAEVLVYPIANNDVNAPSIKENTSPMLTLNAAKLPWFYSFYLVTMDQSNDPRISLVKANLRGLPPTTIINAQSDPLRSEGELLAQKMREAGVQVDQKTYPGTVHEFFGMAAVSDQAKAANAQAFKALRTAFRN